MGLKKKFMQKLGIISTNLAAEFMQFDVGERIPTVAELCGKYNTARGTVQSALKFMQEYGSIKLEPKGHLGTYITDIDYLKLLEIAGIKSLVGVMPLPYSKRYEGLATGIFNTLNDEGLSVNLAFMRGANNRLKSLEDNRYDFAITSRLTADYYVNNNQPIDIICSFGKYSYVNEHIIVTRDDFDGKFKNNMKIGIDMSSIDQLLLTSEHFGSYKVEYIDIPYSQIITAINRKSIDAAIWNKDDIDEHNSNIKTFTIDRRNIGVSDTEAVIIIRKNNIMLQKLFQKRMDTMKIYSYQDKVMKGLIMPNY